MFEDIYKLTKKSYLTLTQLKKEQIVDDTASMMDFQLGLAVFGCLFFFLFSFFFSFLFLKIIIP